MCTHANTQSELQLREDVFDMHKGLSQHNTVVDIELWRFFDNKHKNIQRPKKQCYQIDVFWQTVRRPNSFIDSQMSIS